MKIVQLFVEKLCQVIYYVKKRWIKISKNKETTVVDRTCEAILTQLLV